MSTERIALVTGTSGELGAAIATRLANDGYRVAGLDLRAPETSGRWQHYSCDLTDIPALAATWSRFALVSDRCGCW
jgi:3-oxoacyl-[acyl-carrier protein] reductase